MSASSAPPEKANIVITESRRSGVINAGPQSQPRPATGVPAGAQLSADASLGLDRPELGESETFSSWGLLLVPIAVCLALCLYVGLFVS